MLVLVTAGVVLYLWLGRTFHAMWLVLGSAVGGQVLCAVLKAVFSRPRPDLVPRLMCATFRASPAATA